MGIMVYHYTSLDVLKKILEFKTLRFTKMNSLTDKSEYKYGSQLLKNKIIEFEKNNSVRNPFDIGLLDKFTFSDALYSISFTENGDDLTFWNSYYVDKFTPVCIGFMNDEIFSDGFIINRCIYDDPYAMMSKESYKWFRQIFDVSNILKIPKNHEYIHITFQTAHIKHKAFAIEKEWRAVSFLSKTGLSGKINRDGKEVDYFDQNFKLESIHEVMVGPSKQQELNYQEISSLISNHGLNSLVSKSIIPLEL